MRVEALRQWRRLERRRLFVIIGAGAGFILLVALIGTVIWSRSSDSTSARTNDRSTLGTTIASTVRLTLPPPDLFRPITPEEALKENAERPLSGRPDTPASAFKLQADKSSSERALECLTQAVYYEAASEGAEGQRAVAQIVLNRMRHPAYPASICGVVYQGSERSTGCQFTFTCDGSLARIPVQALWKQARRIATEALAGKVFAPVGHATHYHADYVLPYWADSLDKSVQIGRHIFYRLKSGLGASRIFRQRYAGVEPMPPAPTTVEVSLEAVANAGESLPGPAEASPLEVPVGNLVISSEPKPQLFADALGGTLVVDGGAGRETVSRTRQTEDCDKAKGSTRLRPLSAEDLRGGLDDSSC